MSHVAFVAMAGLRVREDAIRELGMKLPGLRKRAHAIEELPSLGLLTLAGMLPELWTCSYHEASDWNEGFVETLVAEKPMIVAISALTASIEDAYQLSDLLRQQGIRVVIGGLHVTCCPEEAQLRCDSVIVGEGEAVWLRVLQDAESNQLSPIYKADKLFDFTEAPIPRFDLIGNRPRPRMTLQTERGCPFACDFCGASRLLGKFREKPIAQIATEMKALTAVVPRPWLELADDNTFAGDRNPQELFDVLREADARYFTEVDWRIGENPKVLNGLAQSGCVQVLVGLESLVFRYPGMGEKQTELERMMDAVIAIQEAGVVVNGCFIVGAEGETPQSLEKLIEFILDSPLAEIQLTLQTPFPGTMLYQRMKQQGRLIKNRSWSYYTLFDVTFQPEKMSVEELEAGFQHVMKTVFSNEASSKRSILRKQIWQRNPKFKR